MLEFLLDHLYKVAGATVGACILFLHPFYGLAVGIFMAVINFQLLGLMAIFEINLDIVSFGVVVMAIGFEIEYVLHIAHAFLHSKGKGFQRTANSIEEMGITVGMACASTAVQQVVLLAAASSLVFSTYPIVMLLVIIKSGITGFVFVPGILGCGSKILCCNLFLSRETQCNLHKPFSNAVKCKNLSAVQRSTFQQCINLSAVKLSTLYNGFCLSRHSRTISPLGGNKEEKKEENEGSD